jgi:hypothetical protein
MKLDDRDVLESEARAMKHIQPVSIQADAVV